MKYISTREQAGRISLTQALWSGMAPDGGLLVPARLPAFDADSVDAMRELPLERLAARVLAPFFAGDRLESELEAICTEAVTLDAPLRELDTTSALLELFHGPTAAFKDFGARFLAGCMRRLDANEDDPLTILVATSGDTGGAVASAFHGIPGTRVVILYPRGRVTPLQEGQLTCWGGNVTACAVESDFDDCQRLVKQAFADTTLRRRIRLSSANSINLGRLLPQVSYYAWAALAYRAWRGAAAGFAVPTGNVGNALACVWAREMGFPIREVVLATNRNDPVTRYFRTGHWRPRETRETLASAMDVGNPSNMERLLYTLDRTPRLHQALSAEGVDDAAIRAAITAGYRRFGVALCPHTACAVDVVWQRGTDHWVAVATAHAAKFEAIVEPLIGAHVEVPPALAEMLGRAAPAQPLQASLPALRELLAG